MQEPNFARIGMFVGAAWLIGVAIPVGTVAWAHRRRAWLNLQPTRRATIDYALRIFTFAVAPGLIVALLVDPNRGALVTLAIAALYGWRKSLVGDIWNGERVLDAIRAGDRQRALAVAQAAVKRLERHPNLVGVQVSFGISTLLATAGLEDDAIRIMGSFRRELLIGDPLWCREHALASMQIRVGRWEDATSSLDHCRGGTPRAELEEEHRYLRAVIDAATGKAASALGRMRPSDRPEHRYLVEAQAHAANGYDDEALSALEKVRALPFGKGCLQVLANGAGPAKTLAKRLLARSE